MKLLLIVGLVLFISDIATARPKHWVIRDGKFYDRGQWVFLKIAKPLRNFADETEVDQLIADLDQLKRLHYNTIEINCYWHHFDTTGDGIPDKPTAPLRRLVDAIHARGMYPCLSVETYGVGGGQIPKGFWDRHPDAIAIDSDGKPVKDDEYGFGSAVPSFFHPEYLKASRQFIRSITEAVDHAKILYFETTVEPQFMGNHALEFSASGRTAYAAWLKKVGLERPAWPDTFPVPRAFLDDPIFNRFKADSLADWVNGDAAAYRDVAGRDAYIAVDYLETCGPDMRNRNGESRTFLRKLTGADIVQVNWHWVVRTRSPNECAYRNVWEVRREMNRDWAVAEHMTLNGSDYAADHVPDMLRNTIRNGTRFGWEFTNVRDDGHMFSMYQPGWVPKPTMRVVEEQWDQWMAEVRSAAAAARESSKR